MKWEPIESAPKDREILLAIPGFGPIRGRWNDCRFARNPKPYWTNDREGWFGKTSTRRRQPTHWMELPAMPEPAGAEE